MNDKVTVALIDPKWKWGKVIFDGKELPFITLVHPIHVEITCLVPKDIVLKMGKDLISLASNL